MQAARGDSRSEFRPARMRNALVIAQVTVCGFLLICSGVLLRRINHLESLDPGMRTRDILEIYVQPKSRPRAIAALQSRSDVDLLTASSDPPFDATLPRIPVSGASAAAQTVIRYRYVSPDYFQTPEIPVFRGRSFSADEGSSDSGVAVLSESAARKLWPNGDALGQRLNLTPPPSPVPGRRAPRYRTMEVVGIVRDSAVEALDNPDRSALFFPTTIDDSRNALLVRIHGDPEQALRALNAAIEQAEPGAILDIHTEQDYVAAGIWSYRVTYWISAALGCIALLLTISGIYGVLSYVVAQRAKEIGIRMAMGAGTRAVTSLVLAQCARLAAIGIAAGTGLALVAARILSAISAGIAPAVFDRVAYLGGIRSCSPPASPRPSSPPAEPLVSTPSPLFATIKTAPRNTYSPKGQS